MLNYKTAKLNSNQVTGTSAAEWHRVADATNSSKGESIIMRARMARVEVSTVLPSKFVCRCTGLALTIQPRVVNLPVYPPRPISPLPLWLLLESGGLRETNFLRALLNTHLTPT